MRTSTVARRTLLAVSVLLVSFLASAVMTHVEAAANDSSIRLEKDPSVGLFILTVKDPDGVQEFSMTPTDKFPYGVGLSGCKKTFSSNNVLFNDPSDFTPVMPAYVIDCRNNTTELEIPHPVDGETQSVRVKKE